MVAVLVEAFYSSFLMDGVSLFRDRFRKGMFRDYIDMNKMIKGLLIRILYSFENEPFLQKDSCVSVYPCSDRLLLAQRYEVNVERILNFSAP